MATGQTLVNRCLRMLKVVGQGFSATAQESDDALEAINAMLDSWRNDKLMVYSIDDKTLAMVVGDSSYTIGPSGDLNTTRPIKIEQVYMRSSNTDYPVEMVTSEQWDAIQDKTTTSDIVEKAYYNPTMPTGTLKVWPTPSATNSLYLSLRTPVTALTLGGTVSLPPGYELAIVSNGAIHISPEYPDKSLSPTVIEMARSSKAAIKKVNARPIMANHELGLMLNGTHSNILTDA